MLERKVARVKKVRVVMMLRYVVDVRAALTRKTRPLWWTPLASVLKAATTPVHAEGQHRMGLVKKARTLILDISDSMLARTPAEC